MLRHTNAVANIAVTDLDRAAAFYEGVLGLTVVDRMMDEVIVYQSGSTNINVYRSEFAGTNKATAVTWNVGEKLSETVAALKKQKVAFEHYEMPGAVMDGDIHVFGDHRVAWFKDPDGNILNLVNA